ncbi:hypothetical protein ABZ678_02915 [Streptomyces hirsutus]|uniref:hypothetical protein n=1 Tax=Streptomyces hirsutus TaxID=35620 RepID=UPI0033E8491D
MADVGPQPQDARDAPELLRLVTTDGIRDPLPAASGIPGQRAMLLPVAGPSRGTAEVIEGQDDGAPPYGRCEGCRRPLTRAGRKRCAGCPPMPESHYPQAEQEAR